MKKIIFLLSILLISNNCLAAGSSDDGATKIDLYKTAKKLVLRAKKLEKKNKIDKALKLYSKAYDRLIKAYKKGISINEKTVLKRYEIRRKGINLLMLKSMDFFINIFNSQNLYLRLLRNWGLNSVNKTKFIKAFFIKHASGFNRI